MLRLLCPLLTLLALFTATHAAPLRFQVESDQAVSLQQSLYPDLYATRDPGADIDRAVRVWNGARLWLDSLGPLFQQRLTSLSGLAESDSLIPILPLWYYPTLGNADPLIIPFGGFQNDGRIEAPLWGEEQRFQLCYLLSMRHLLRARENQSANLTILRTHPLMQPGTTGLTLLSLQLAWQLGESLFTDSVRARFVASPFWKGELDGYQVWEDQLKSRWLFTTEKPLIRWLLDGDASRLIVQALQTTSDEPATITEEAIPPTGLLGIVFRGSGLTINSLDTNRLAFRWGIRVGDQLIGVDGGKPRTQKEAVEQLLAGWDKKSGRVSVTRKGKSETIYIRSVPIKLPSTP